MDYRKLGRFSSVRNKVEQKLDRLEEGYAPVTISWDRKKILDYLLLQYNKGNAEAADLLYLQLYNDIRAFLKDAKITEVNDTTREKIVACIKECSEYPKSIIAEMLRDFEEKAVELTVRVPEETRSTDNGDADDMPF